MLTFTVVSSERYVDGVIWLTVPGYDAEIGDVVTPVGTANFPEINGRSFVVSGDYNYGYIPPDGMASFMHPGWVGLGLFEHTEVAATPDTGFVEVIRDQPEENDMFTPTSVATKTQSVFAPRAITYLHGQASGAVDLPRQFHGFGPLLAFSVPSGQQVTAFLLPPEGPRADGFHPRAQVTVTGGSTDLVITEA